MIPQEHQSSENSTTNGHESFCFICVSLCPFAVLESPNDCEEMGALKSTRKSPTTSSSFLLHGALTHFPEELKIAAQRQTNFVRPGIAISTLGAGPQA